MEKPICELCGKEMAICFAENQENHQWRFTCAYCQPGEYWFPITSFFRDPYTTSDWMDHLRERTDFDYPNFLSMLKRYRDATGSDNQFLKSL